MPQRARFVHREAEEIQGPVHIHLVGCLGDKFGARDKSAARWKITEISNSLRSRSRK